MLFSLSQLHTIAFIQSDNSLDTLSDKLHLLLCKNMPSEIEALQYYGLYKIHSMPRQLTIIFQYIHVLRLKSVVSFCIPLKLTLFTELGENVLMTSFIKKTDSLHRHFHDTGMSNSVKLTGRPETWLSADSALICCVQVSVLLYLCKHISSPEYLL